MPQAGAETAKVTASAAILPGEGNRPARLAVTARMAPGWHIYSLGQAQPMIATKIKLDPSSDFRVTGDFTASQPPAKHQEPDIFPGVTIEEHAGEVTWQAPIELAPGVDPAKIRITGAVYAQACQCACSRRTTSLLRRWPPRPPRQQAALPKAPFRFRQLAQPHSRRNAANQQASRHLGSA